jgi:hypothetical protein
MEFLGAFYAVYGIGWLVFAAAPGHELCKHRVDLTPRDWQHTEAVIQEQFSSVRKKRAA